MQAPSVEGGLHLLSRWGTMPEISRFLGIAIEAQLRISPVCVLAGRLPPRVLALIVEWASRYQAELLANWLRCERKEPLTRIPPLE